MPASSRTLPEPRQRRWIIYSQPSWRRHATEAVARTLAMATAMAALVATLGAGHAWPGRTSGSWNARA